MMSSLDQYLIARKYQFIQAYSIHMKLHYGTNLRGIVHDPDRSFHGHAIASFLMMSIDKIR